MTVDRQRIDAVELLDSRRFIWSNGAWSRPEAATIVPAADMMHGVLMDRAEALAGCTEGSDEEDELRAVAAALDVYEAARWPDGKIPGGKG